MQEIKFHFKLMQHQDTTLLQTFEIGQTGRDDAWRIVNFYEMAVM